MDDPLLSDNEETDYHTGRDSDEDSTTANNNSLRRKVVSEARWSLAGLAEVVTRKGKLWTTMGIVRQGKLLCHIEETVFLVQQGAVRLFNNQDSIMPLMDLYGLLASCKYGCSWNECLVYSYLKTLGYIVGRHNVPWTDTFRRVGSTQLEEMEDQNKNLSRISGSLEGHLPGSLKTVDAPQESCIIEGIASQVGADKLKPFLNDVSVTEGIHKLKLGVPKNMDSWQENLLEERIPNHLVFNENINQAMNYASEEHYSFSLQHAKNILEKKNSVTVDVGDSEVSMEASISAFKPMNSTTRLHLGNHTDLLWTDASSIHTCGELKLMFDVYLPNSKFKKTNPGDPAFRLCIKSDRPPQQIDLKWLETLSGAVPVKIASVDCHCVYFFSFDMVVLPQLP